MREMQAKVRKYYSGTLQRHGPTPLGVDWPNVVSQYLRFVQLLKLCRFGQPFSLNDFGWLRRAAGVPGDAPCRCGVTIAASIFASDGCCRARPLGRQQPGRVRGGFAMRRPRRFAHSGTLNVRLGHPVAEWEAYVEAILIDLEACSRIGFAVNFMLPRHEAPAEAGLYRTAPERWTPFANGSAGRIDHRLRTSGTHTSCPQDDAGDRTTGNRLS